MMTTERIIYAETLALNLTNNVPTNAQIISYATELNGHIDTVWVMIILIMIFNM